MSDRQARSAATTQRYELVARWSSMNHQYGWVIWDTKLDKKASGWHRDQHHLARACDVMNNAVPHEDYIEAIKRVGVDRG